MLAGKADLLEAFGTSDRRVICSVRTTPSSLFSLTLSLQEILEKGDLQVTELERQALIEGMFRDVATIVTDKSVNPETDRPYTISMIQNAMKDIHYSVSLNKNAKQQALDVIRRLRKVMPIARVLMSLKITLALSCESSHILGPTADPHSLPPPPLAPRLRSNERLPDTKSCNFSQRHCLRDDPFICGDRPQRLPLTPREPYRCV